MNLTLGDFESLKSRYADLAARLDADEKSLEFWREGKEDELERQEQLKLALKEELD